MDFENRSSSVNKIRIQNTFLMSVVAKSFVPETKTESFVIILRNLENERQVMQNIRGIK